MNITVQIPAVLRPKVRRVVQMGYWGGNESQVASRFVLERLMELTGQEPDEIEGFRRGDVGGPSEEFDDE